MARQGRLALPQHVHHVGLRGNSKQLIFVDVNDKERLIEIVKNSAKEAEVEVHAFAFFSSRISLILTPQKEESLSKMMQNLGRSYVRYFNNKYHRSGTLWDGRYRSAVLDPDEFLLPIMACLDAASAQEAGYLEAETYPWSSCHVYVGGETLSWLKKPAIYWNLANTPFAREACYREILKANIEFSQQILKTLDTALVLGSAVFNVNLQKATSRRITQNKVGRPKKS